MDQLVVAALQEGRVDRHDRPHALAGEPRGQRHGMLLGDGDVEVALREAALELHQAGALAHGGRDADDAPVALRHVAQPLPEDLRVARPGGSLLLQLTTGGIERPRPVPLDRVGLRGRIALALLGHDVQQLRALAVAHVVQRRDERADVMAVHRPDVVEAHLLEQGARQHHALGVDFRTPGQLPGGGGHAPEHLLGVLAKVLVHLARQQPGQVVGQRADILRDRHVVVVQDHQQVDVEAAGVVQRFPCEPRAHGAVADDGRHAAVAALQAVGDRHAQRGADRGAGVADPEGVVDALLAGRERGQPALVLDRLQRFASARQHLVRIGLVADVPDEPVVRRVEHVVQRHGQLDGAEPGREVPAALADRMHEEVAEFCADRGQLRLRQRAQHRRGIDRREQRILAGIGHG